MRLRVSSIDNSVTKQSLQEMFEEFGEIAMLKLFRSVDSNSPALGFVEMKRERDALLAIAKLNGKMIGTNKLKVEVSTDYVKLPNTGKPVTPYDRDEDEDLDDEEDEEEEEETEDDSDDLNEPEFDNDVSIEDVADEY